MGNEKLYGEIAEKLVEINHKQKSRWDGMTGDEFRETTQQAMGGIVEVEELVARSGYDTGVVHKAGSVFNFAYQGRLWNDEQEKVPKEQLVNAVMNWVRDDMRCRA